MCHYEFDIHEIFDNKENVCVCVCVCVPQQWGKVSQPVFSWVTHWVEEIWPYKPTNREGGLREGDMDMCAILLKKQFIKTWRKTNNGSRDNTTLSLYHLVYATAKKQKHTRESGFDRCNFKCFQIIVMSYILQLSGFECIWRTAKNNSSSPIVGVRENPTHCIF